MQVPEVRAHSLSPRGLAIAGWAAFALAGAAFFVLAWNVAARTALVLFDISVTAFFNANRVPELTTLMLGITYAHSILAVSIWSVLFAAVLARMRQWSWLLTLALAMGGGMAVNYGLKVAYERARPAFDEPLLTLKTFSFPSGHTAGATLFYGVLAAFLVSRIRDLQLRATIVAVAVVMVVAVAFSRVYLGAHFVSDVVAAACSSMAWLALCLSTVHALVRRKMATA